MTKLKNQSTIVKKKKTYPSCFLESNLIMADKSHTRGTTLQYWKRKKARTNKILDRLTYNPSTHKQKFTKSLREKLKKQRVVRSSVRETNEELKFASMNVNGLDSVAKEAVMEILLDRKYDVSHICLLNKTNR